VLLSIVVVRSLAARGWRRPSMGELAVLFGLGLAVCSLPQVPAPWSQLARLQAPASVAIYRRADVRRFVAEQTQPGAPVAILTPLGHRIAYDLGRTNIAPYSGVESMPTEQQAQTTIDLLHRAHVHRVFLSINDTSPGDILGEVTGAFQHAGFSMRARGPEIVELSDEALR
jgi:hypothetical protein